MVINDHIREMEQAVILLREQIEIIRINLEILESLRKSGRIKQTDEEYTGIILLHERLGKSFEDFVLNQLPQLIVTDAETGNKELLDSFVDWSAGMHLSLNSLDSAIKDYIHMMIETGQSLKITTKDPLIKDQRFWKFLDQDQDRARLFDSFDEPENSGGSNQVSDPEE